MTCAPADDGVRTLVSALVDDAGLFPPTALRVDDALRRYAGLRQSEQPTFTGTFVASTNHVVALQTALPADARLRLSIVVGGSREVSELAHAASDPRLTFTALEFLPGATRRDVTEVLDAIAGIWVFADAPDVYLELGLEDLDRHLVSTIAKQGWSAKLRCGGTVPDAFPTPDQLGRAIHLLVGQGVAFKATAGLHHALPYVDPSTGLSHYGFLELLAAVHAAQSGASISAVSRALSTDDGQALVAATRAMPPRVAATVRDAFRTFGCCDPTQPQADVDSLLLDRGDHDHPPH
jgi:hypothetical protein